MLPWSVTATAGMPSSATRLQSSGQPVRAVEEGVLAVEVEVDEVAGHRASIIAIAATEEKLPAAQGLTRIVSATTA